MDEVKIQSRFLTGIIGKILSSVIKKKLGSRVIFDIGNINIKFVDGKANLDLSVKAEMPEEDLKDLITHYI